MRVLIPLMAMFSFVLLTGCATPTATQDAASTCCGSSIPGQCADGSPCAEGKECSGGTCTLTKADSTCCADCTSCTSEKTAESVGDAVPAASTEPVATISASGMSCPLCASNIDRRLQKVDGVKWTNIDLGNGIVTVGLEPDAEAPAAEELQTAIRDAGYTAGEVTMPAGEVTP